MQTAIRDKADTSDCEYDADESSVGSLSLSDNEGPHNAIVMDSERSAIFPLNSMYLLYLHILCLYCKANSLSLKVGLTVLSDIFIFTLINTYLLLAECEVRTASYEPNFFPSFYGPSAKRAGHENKEGKNEDP